MEACLRKGISCVGFRDTDLGHFYAGSSMKQSRGSLTNGIRRKYSTSALKTFLRLGIRSSEGRECDEQYRHDYFENKVLAAHAKH